MSENEIKDSETIIEKPFAYRVKTFCRRFEISSSTFWLLVQKGEIKTIKLGGSTLVPSTEVARLLGKTEL